MPVDRSGTNRLPWPSLARVAPNVQVAGGVAAILGAAAVLFAYRRSVATTPRTMSDEWREATVKMDLAKERVAGEPVEVNPIRHAAKKKL
ncbi:hypothetical protein I4F81_004357 [Pyropia yezoensis]|uniref:Uncharacterized protein n=1 Tax=Pyropia yezoensis TaxID=2788 RepID=A0ACC3BW70_PYRYE|nr:hypothetical protein I4F81_004357 [Neopyropia yezoensis]